MTIADREHLHAVPNNNNQNGNGNSTTELIKTVAITSAVSSLVGVFAVAGGQALWHLLRRAINGKPKKKNESAQAQQNPPWWAAPPEERSSADPPWWANPSEDEEEIPPSLRYQPRFRGGRRRRPNPERTNEKPVEQNFDFRAAFSEFATKLDARMANLERRVEEFDYEEEDA